MRTMQRNPSFDFPSREDLLWLPGGPQFIPDTERSTSYERVYRSHGPVPEKSRRSSWLRRSAISRHNSGPGPVGGRGCNFRLFAAPLDGGDASGRQLSAA